ncbi:helix-turn-helix domain-containing protein [Vibrio neptunius]|uniref:Helix-turn-helix transcriptional regulator n=1 Tax=Vibrio neptunius TaxID=170651 RepID=A0ABS2ZXC4_9VIBR|nr:helix-turn-helix transcriptional regulator [Vibrio neptunius]MBN3549328.1 helix-turn-helix transcriptional regulator [Vibrio neptunius]MBN3576853.1 helix-turn-helix transcriptional regulator [Vibrio neptunius]MCH9870517.1 helix-turn-helix transcriptional regulator [Vibrio neptunius]
MPRKNKALEPIVEYLVQLRMTKRETQEQIATQTGISLSSYQRIEQGNRDPRLSELKVLLEYYNVTWLDVAWAELGKRSISEIDLAAAMKHVPAHIRQPILELIKAVSS